VRPNIPAPVTRVTSPRRFNDASSPRIPTQSPRLVQLPDLVPIQSVIVGDAETKKEHVDCCICMDIKVDKTTKCGHSICKDCTQKLPNLACPMCRTTLEGGYIPDAMGSIYLNMERTKRTTELENMVYSLSINIGYRDAQARTLANAFKTFIDMNPDMTERMCRVIFRGFLQFMDQERIEDPEVAIRQFELIGVAMLSGMSFDDAYTRFFATIHPEL
jgi:hypothetical protein